MFHRSRKLVAKVCRRRPLVPLLVLATVCLNAVALFQLSLSVQKVPSQMGWLMALTDAVIIGQLQVFAVWLAVGGRAWIWRFLIVILTVALYAVVLSGDSEQVSYWVAVAMLYLLVGGVLSWIAIAISKRFTAKPAKARRRKGRFKVGNLMATMFACSVAFAILVQADFTTALSGWITILVSSVMLAVFVAISRWSYQGMAFLLIANLPLNLTAILHMTGSEVINDVGYLYEHQIIYGLFVAAWLVGARVKRRPTPLAADAGQADKGKQQEPSEQVLRLFSPTAGVPRLPERIDLTV